MTIASNLGFPRIGRRRELKFALDRHWAGELDDPQTEGQRLIRSLEPRAVWMSHAAEPWRPSAS